MPYLTRAPIRITPGSRGATMIDQALVTWVRGSDSVLRLDGVSADAAFCLMSTITGGMREPAYAEYSPS